MSKPESAGAVEGAPVIGYRAPVAGHREPAVLAEAPAPVPDDEPMPTHRRKSVDLEPGVLATLRARAQAEGMTLPAYLNAVLAEAAGRCGFALPEFNCSPSYDPYFDDPENLRDMEEGHQQFLRGEFSVLTDEELRELLGL